MMVLRRVAIASSLGLSRLLGAAAAPPAASRTLILGRFIASQPSIPLIRGFGPVMELRRGYAWGRDDDCESDEEEYEEEGDFGEVEIDGSDLSDAEKMVFDSEVEDVEFHSDEEI